ncbi:MAG: GDSL-type esterase/lipase family protein [Candidatus Hydrogenedentota bacterium]
MARKGHSYREYGFFLSPEDTYPNQLEQILRASGCRVSVVNGGAEGYKSWENLASLLFRAPEIEPDIVIIHEGFNDVGARLVLPGRYLPDNRGNAGPFRDYPPEEWWRKSNFLRICAVASGRAIGSNSLQYQQRQPLFLPLLLTKQLREGRYPSGVFAKYPVDELLRCNAPTHYRRNLKMQAAACQQNDWELVFATMAFGVPGSDPLIAECRIEGVRENNAVMRNVAQEAQVSLCDLEKVMPQDASLYVDGLHTTTDGAVAKAQAIANFLLDNMIVSPTSEPVATSPATQNIPVSRKTAIE